MVVDIAMAENDKFDWFNEQLVDVQSQLAFQEDTIASLNEVVTRQQSQIENLYELIKNQKSLLETLSVDNENDIIDERPPHY